MAEALAERLFAFADQEAFAAVSGDCNPIHFDAVAARRELAKQPIVHGAHMLLWGLDAFFAQAKDARAVAGVKTTFEKFAPVGATLRAFVASLGPTRDRIDILCDGEVAMTAVISYGEPAPAAPRAFDGPSFAPAAPLALRFEDLPGALERGVCSLSPGLAKQSFPAAARALGAARVAGIAGASFVVGMVCPGLSSLFRSLQLTTTALADHERELRFELSRLDPRFRLVRLAVAGAGWTGAVDAHFRPPPVAQPTIGEVARLCAPREFEGARALVVGGSRGLGELIAKTVAAGGGEVFLTYAAGEADARRVQAEIESFGARCEILRYDALAPCAPQLAALGPTPNQLYYMASPAIVPRRKSDFDRALLDRYLGYYVDGLHALVQTLTANSDGRLSLFYPSTVFVEERPESFAEYAMAKASGEILCAEMAAASGKLATTIARLPRLETDQTLAIGREAFPDAPDVLMPWARRVHAASLEPPPR